MNNAASLVRARRLIAGEAQLELTANGRSERFLRMCLLVGELCELIGDDG